MEIRNILYFLVFTISTLYVKSEQSNSCDVGPLADEIASYSNVVKEIIDYVVTGPFKGKTYAELAKFVDKFGARPSGSEALEQSIDYMIDLSRQEGLTDIVTEELEVPHWTRGEEKAVMLQPRLKNIALVGLSNSVPTPTEGYTAEVVVFRNFTELDASRDDAITGKIVLFDPVYRNYDESFILRSQGANKASRKGAIAALVRSITPFSLYTLHTGLQFFDKDVVKIPAAAITLEDADLIRRFYDRGVKVVLNMKLMSQSETGISRNTLIDLKGTKNPEKLVVVSGHIDSWDLGQGAMDDGGGVFVSWAAPVIMKRLNLIPKRTIRSILWTAEELGFIGAYAYEKRHRNELDNINYLMESDEGTFAPLGLKVIGNKKAKCIMLEILKLFQVINASALVETEEIGSDLDVLISKGIPAASLLTKNDRYFWYHHSEADTLNIENPDELDLCSAFWTAVAYIVANLSVDIPR